MDGLADLFPIISESDAIAGEWRQLVELYQVSGKNTHDARIVAAMKVNRVHRILTFNGQDFARFAGIDILDPRSLRA